MQKNHFSTLILAAFIFISLQTFAAVETHETQKDCSLGRQTVQEHGQMIYIVQSRAPSLYMISRDLYGTETNWNNIARWNQLTAPYSLEKGQRLIIKVPPRLNDEDGTKILIQAWTRFNDTDKASRLSAYLEQCVQKPAIEEEKEAAIAPPIAVPVKEEVKHEEPKKEEAHLEKEEHEESPWEFSTKLVGSYLQIDSTEHLTGVKNTLYSKINYGLELGVEREFSHRWALSAAANLTHFEMEQPSGSEIDHDKQNLLKFKLDLDDKFSEVFKMAIGSVYSQHLFGEPTPQGVDMHALWINEFNLGASVRLTKGATTELWFSAEGIYALSTSQKGFDVKSGQGYAASFTLAHEMKHSKMTITPKYEFLHQDTEASKDQEQTTSLDLGWSW